MTQSELAFKVRADAQGAAAEIRKVRDDLRALGPAGRDAAQGILPLGAALGGAGSGMTNLVRVSGAGRAVLQNTSYQLGDMAVQLAAGTRPAQVLAQQLPQLLGGFGMLGGSLGIVLPLLGTLAAIGIPVAVALGSIGDATAAASDQNRAFAATLEEARGALDKVREAAERRGTEGLEAAAETYGEVSAAVQVLIERLDQLERKRAKIKVNEALDAALGDQFQAQVESLFGAVAPALTGAFAGEVEWLRGQIADLEADFANRQAAGIFIRPEEFDQLTRWKQELAAITGDMANLGELASGITLDPSLLQRLTEAKQALDAARAASDFRGVADALALIYGALRDSGAELDEGVLPQLLEAEEVARQAAFALGEGKDAATGIASSGMADEIAKARAEAVGLAAQLNISLEAAMKIRAQQALDSRTQDFTPGNQALRAYGSRAPGGTAEQRALERRNAPPAPPRAPSGTGARSAGGGGVPDRNSVAGLAAQGMALLSDLGIAQAAVAEKVRAGLMTVAEGQDAMSRAKEQAANRLADLIARLDALGPAGEGAADTARQALAELVPQIESVGGALEKSLVQNFEEGFARSIATGKNHMTAFADHVKMELARAFTNRFITPLITPLINSLVGILPFAQGGVPGAAVPGLQAFAQGGVPGLPALADHRNTVVDRPTLFAMGGAQTGLMGEAGPEAIMPLQQGPDGLGVMATGPGGESGVLPLTRAAGGKLAVAVPGVVPFAQGGVPALRGLRVAMPPAPYVPGRNGPPGTGSGSGASPAPPPARPAPVSVVVNNHSPAKVEARETLSSDGTRIEVLVEQVESALAERKARGIGALAQVDSSIFGQTRRGR